MEDKLSNIVTGISVFVIILFVFLLAKRFGLIFPKSKSDKVWEDTIAEEMQAEKTIMETPYLDPNYWREKGKSSLNANVLEDWAEQLNDAFGGWWTGGDDEPAIYSVFEEVGSGDVLSMVADVYGKMFKESLRGKLIDKLDTSELNQLVIIIKKYK